MSSRKKEFEIINIPVAMNEAGEICRESQEFLETHFIRPACNTAILRPGVHVQWRKAAYRAREKVGLRCRNRSAWRWPGRRADAPPRPPLFLLSRSPGQSESCHIRKGQRGWGC